MLIRAENLFVANTYKAILERIARDVLLQAQLIRSTRATTITSNPKLDADHPLSIAVSTDNKDAPSLYDEVVVTAPLGYLKRNLAAFSPPLPDDLIKAISHVSYGRLEKAYITFPKAYWVDRSTANDKQFFTHFLNPTYAQEQNPSHWNVEFVSLASLPGDVAHPTLLFYMHGECAARVTSLINGLDPTSQEYYKSLKDFFEPYYARLPNYSASSAHCVPKGVLATNWQNDEFAGYGSYTNFQVSKGDEQVLLDKDIETLRYGAPERHIWFAGEHTAPFVALGTVTGAYWSGEAVAKRILDAYGIADGVEGEKELSTGASGEAQNGEPKGTLHGAGLVGL